MNEVMAILELWIKSSKTEQEADTKIFLVEKGLQRIRNEYRERSKHNEYGSCND